MYAIVIMGADGTPANVLLGFATPLAAQQHVESDLAGTTCKIVPAEYKVPDSPEEFLQQLADKEPGRSKVWYIVALRRKFQHLGLYDAKSLVARVIPGAE